MIRDDRQTQQAASEQQSSLSSLFTYNCDIAPLLSSRVLQALRANVSDVTGFLLKRSIARERLGKLDSSLEDALQTFQVGAGIRTRGE